MCDVDTEAVASCVDAPSIYDIPKVLHGEGLDAYVIRRLGLPFRDVDWTDWDDLLRRVHHPEHERRDRPGRQVHRPARRLPLGHRGDARRRLPPRRQGAHPLGGLRRVRDRGRCPEGARRRRRGAACPAGSASAASRASSAPCGGPASGRSPTLGICLGLQCMVIEYARNVAGIADASSSEFDPDTRAPGHRDDGGAEGLRRGAGDLGGTMRLGAYPAHLTAGSVAGARPTAPTRVDERHRHRYEVNNAYREQLEEAGLRFSGTSPDGTLVEFVELPARRAPVLRLDPGAPGVPVAAAPGAPAVRGPGRAPRSTPSGPPGSSRSSARRRPRRCRRRDAGGADRARRGAGGPAGATAGRAQRDGSSRAWSGTSCATPSTSVRAATVRREYIQHPGAVAVVALDDRGRVLLIQQYRHPVGTFEWELPAGLLDVAGEPPWQARGARAARGGRPRGRPLGRPRWTTTPRPAG